MLSSCHWPVATLAVLLSILVETGDTKLVHGFLRTGDNWAFMARFCFLSLHGKFQYEVRI